jgi:hypothetical protein
VTSPSPMVELVETREADSVADVNNLDHRALALRGSPYLRRYSSTALRTNFDTDDRSETALR